MKIYTIIIVILCLQSTWTVAQQLPLFTSNSQYQFTTNPATSQIDNLVFGADINNFVGIASRKQWTGIQNGPLTLMARYDRRFEDMNMLAGLTLIKDKTGPTSTTGGILRYAYEMPLGDGSLSIGLASGFFQYSFKGDQSYLRDANDFIGLEMDSRTYVDFSLGVFYSTELRYNDIFYAGLSIPQITGIKISAEEDYTVYRKRHYHAKIGYYKFLENISQDNHEAFLEASLTSNYAETSPFQNMFNLRFQLPTVVWIGGGYAMSYGQQGFYSDIMRFEVGLILNNGYDTRLLRIGYAIDKSLSVYSLQLGSSHELNLSYAF